MAYPLYGYIKHCMLLFPRIKIGKKSVKLEQQSVFEKSGQHMQQQHLAIFQPEI